MSAIGNFSNGAAASSSASSYVAEERDQNGYFDLAVEKHSPIKMLPPEILQVVLFNPVLSDQDRIQASLVCKGWKALIYDKHPYGLAVTVYGKKDWETYFGYQIVGEVPPMPSSEEVRLTRSQLKGEKETPRCMLALMPNGLNLNKLIELMKQPLKGDATPIGYISPKIVEKFGNKAIEETRWVLFTEGVIEGSKGKSYDQQKALVASKTDGKCALPDLIDAVACVALKRAKTGECIMGVKPLTYTRCQETINECPLVVGSFSSSGLSVICNIYDCVIHGVAACRKF